MSTGHKIPLEKAILYANRFLELIKPHVIKAEIAGSVRRQQPMVGDIEIVCIEDMSSPLNTLFTKEYPGIVKNGERLKSFQYESAKIELYIAQPHDYGRILAIRTGSSAFSHFKLAITWNRLGWSGTSDGLRRKKECINKSSKWTIRPEYADDPTLPPVFNTEYDFFDFLGIEWIPPEQRNWVAKDDKFNYNV